MPTVQYNGFEWNADKAASNEAKHGVTFAEATTVFADDFFVVKRDVTHSFDENRYLILGCSETGRYLIVAYTERRETTRLISAREMTPSERWSYEHEEE
jgi:hypothetical protein